jgi:hypothetical protein
MLLSFETRFEMESFHCCFLRENEDNGELSLLSGISVGELFFRVVALLIGL